MSDGLRYTPPPEPMSDEQFYLVVGALLIGVAGAAVFMGAVTWVLG